MRDSEVVASIVAGDSLGLAASYDRYADPLYQYCRTLLSDPADAADAVQDTFVIAASRLDRLRDPDRLRPWLYAVARNEALRILRSKKGTSALHEAPDVTDDSGDAAADADRAYLRALLEDATAGLNPAEREVIELQLRQGLETAEVATVLGVSRNHAHALLSRARGQLETCLAVLLVGRAGRGECDELGRPARGLGRPADDPAPQSRSPAHRAVRDLRRQARPRAAPGHAARPVPRRGARGRGRGDLAAARGGRAGRPAGRTRSRSPPARRSARSRTGPPCSAGRGRSAGAGSPSQAHGAAAGPGARRRAGRAGTLRSAPRGVATVTAVIVIAAIIAAVAFALTGNSQGAKPTAGPKAPTVTAAPAAATSAASARASAAVTKTAPTATPTAASAPATPSTVTTPTTTAPTPSTVTSPSGTATSASPTAAASTPAPAPTPGALSEYPRGGTLVVAPDGSRGAQIDLSGSGTGHWYVHWSLAVANDRGNVISVSSSSGTLTSADSTATVTVTANRFVPCGRPRSPTITISPGGAVFSVCTSWSGQFTGGGAARAVDDAVDELPRGRGPKDRVTPGNEIVNLLIGAL